MTELLVITACLYGEGCSESYAQYYESKPSLQHFIMKTERETERILGKNFVTYMVPPLAFIAGTTATSKISNSFNLKYSRSFIELIFKKEF